MNSREYRSWPLIELHAQNELTVNPNSVDAHDKLFLIAEIKRLSTNWTYKLLLKRFLLHCEQLSDFHMPYAHDILSEEDIEKLERLQKEATQERSRTVEESNVRAIMTALLRQGCKEDVSSLAKNIEKNFQFAYDGSAKLTAEAKILWLRNYFKTQSERFFKE